MKRSVMIRTICLVAAVLVLGSAVAYAAVTGSPYETLKKSVLDSITIHNATSETNATISVDGVVKNGEYGLIVRGDNSAIVYNIDKDGNKTGYSYFTDGLTLHSSGYSKVDIDGVKTEAQQYSVTIMPKTQNDGRYSGGILGSVLTEEDRNSARVRFLELLIDALVGDLKNNVTMTSENGIRHIKGTLTEAQVPELAKSGIDMLIEQSSSGRRYSISVPSEIIGSNYISEQSYFDKGMKTVSKYSQPVRLFTDEELEAYNNGTLFSDESIFSDEKYIQGSGIDPSLSQYGYTKYNGKVYAFTGERKLVSETTAPVTRADYASEDVLSIPMKSLTINYVHGEADIDKAGNLTDATLTANLTIVNIFGDKHEVEIAANVKFTDIGTSKAGCPIAGLEKIFTEDFVKAHGGREYSSFYFTLSPDGSVNVDSITDSYSYAFGPGPSSVEVWPQDIPAQPAVIQ